MVWQKPRWITICKNRRMNPELYLEKNAFQFAAGEKQSTACFLPAHLMK